MNGKKEVKELSLEALKEDVDIILRDKLPVWRRNSEGQMVIIPIENLSRFINEEDAAGYRFYIEKGKLEKAREGTMTWSGSFDREGVLLKQLKDYGEIKQQVEKFNKLTVIEREELLDECIEGLSKGSKELNIDLVVKMIDVICRTFYANNAGLVDSSGSENVRDNISGIIVKTNWIVKVIIGLLENPEDISGSYRLLEKIDTGSKTMNHISRVFVMFISFCVFFNDYIDRGLFTRQIRAVFRERYLRYYRKRLPDTTISIERIFQGGIRRIDKDKELVNYALGALLFDIGKISNIDYHDGTDPFDPGEVKKHVLNGYNMIIRTQKYPFEVLAMTALHHEYYSGKGSYNFTCPIVSRLCGKKVDHNNISYFISYSKDDFIEGDSLSFFPVKILEIADIFDAMAFGKSKAPFEVVKMMKKEHISSVLKIDPVLFRIFMEYLCASGAVNSYEIEEIDSSI